MLSKCWPLRICAGRDVIKVVCVVEILGRGKGIDFFPILRYVHSYPVDGGTVWPNRQPFRRERGFPHKSVVVIPAAECFEEDENEIELRTAKRHSAPQII